MIYIHINTYICNIHIYIYKYIYIYGIHTYKFIHTYIIYIYINIYIYNTVIYILFTVGVIYISHDVPPNFHKLVKCRRLLRFGIINVKNDLQIWNSVLCWMRRKTHAKDFFHSQQLERNWHMFKSL